MRELIMQVNNTKTICVDIDGCLCSQTAGNYADAQPIEEAIKVVNELYDEGHKIILHTARFMNRHNGDVQKVYEEGHEFTKNQLDSWGVRYHELILGKPFADILIDDRAVFFDADWERIRAHVRDKLN